MQEAYRPQCIKYYSVGYPPPARSDGGEGYPRWGTPLSGYPKPGLMGVPKVGFPPAGVSLPARSDEGGGRVPEVGYPLTGYPPARSDRGYPPSGYPPPGPGQGTPPPHPGVDRQTDGWMDRHMSKHNLPSYYVRGR